MTAQFEYLDKAEHGRYGTASYKGGIHIWVWREVGESLPTQLCIKSEKFNRLVKGDHVIEPDLRVLAYMIADQEWPFPTWETPKWRRFGFVAVEGTMSGLRTFPRGWAGPDLHGLTIPYYAPVAVLAVLPLCTVLGHIRRAARRRRGSCAICGYDLRASPKRCPECGLVPTTR